MTPAEAGVTVTLTSLALRTYVLERSLDLRTWSPVHTNRAANYTLKLQDRLAPELGHRFYRVVRVGP